MNYRLIASRLMAMADQLELDHSKMNDLNISVDGTRNEEMEILGDDDVLSNAERNWMSSHGFKEVKIENPDKKVFSKAIPNFSGVNNEIVFVKEVERNRFGIRKNPGARGSGELGMGYWHLLFPGSRDDGYSKQRETLEDVSRYDLFLYHEEFFVLSDSAYRSAVEREIKRIKEINSYTLGVLKQDLRKEEFYNQEIGGTGSGNLNGLLDL